MSLDRLHELMDWPTRREVLSPSGAGPRVLADLARAKIETAIRREMGGGSVKVGLLTKNPYANSTQAPVAVVCEFGRMVTPQTLALAHRLAWNFARAPLLVTIEPHLVRAWTCCEPPSDERSLLAPTTPEIGDAQLDLKTRLTASQQAAHALHWVRLASGDFYQRFPDRFRRDGRADRILLEELTRVRKRLKRQGLADDTIHDLLARVVFSQFLFDRKDADGQPALNRSLLAALHDDRTLAATHQGLASILDDRDEAYRFFRWLNDKFNGDLFPGKGKTEKEREAEWGGEKERVKPEHLRTLADFVGGRMRGRQRVLWRQYSFDVIPLEFISSIYEQFVTAKGAFYTPAYLVDFMLDVVLPWDEDQWDLKVLDPACGSGIFLVKAYQRLVQRWKNANPGQKPPTRILKRLLERNLLGVDIDPHAVRVASFSLYLTMCDEIDPKTYLKTTKVPRLRDRRLICGDFFQEDVQGFSTKADGATYDLVVGNAPWGENTETEHARQWADNAERKWPIPNRAIGTLFLPKAASLTKPGGRISMIQPASSLLFNRSGPANRFRKRLFSEFKVEEIVNLSTLRFELFENATSPPCIVTMQPSEPDDQPLLYASPKQVKVPGGAEVAESTYAIVIEPHDISKIWPDEARANPFVWTALAWGGRRDLQLMARLARYPSIERQRERSVVVTSEGVIRGNRATSDDTLVGRRVLLEDAFPANTFLRLDASTLPINEDPSFERPRTRYRDAFRIPQLIVKQGWTVGTGRFQAALTETPEHDDGIVCSQSYITAHVPREHESFLESAAVTYNSLLAVYYLLLSSGRLASYRPEPLAKEIRSVPVPELPGDSIDGLSSLPDVDNLIRSAFALKDSEWALIEDLFQYTMPDFKGGETSPGRQPTGRNTKPKAVWEREPHLAPYCGYFIRVLKAGFGLDKPVSATIYQDDPEARLPVRLVAIHLNWRGKEDIAVEPIEAGDLCQRLRELDEKFLKPRGRREGGILYQRVAKIYDEFRHNGRKIPTVYIVKPDQVRYWTRSVALRDADEVAADVALWMRSGPRARRGQKPK